MNRMIVKVGKRCVVAGLPDIGPLDGVSRKSKDPVVLSSLKVLVIVGIFIATFREATKAVYI